MQPSPVPEMNCWGRDSAGKGARWGPHRRTGCPGLSASSSPLLLLQIHQRAHLPGLHFSCSSTWTQSNMSLSPDGSPAHHPKRRRTAHACDSCRSRKTRCDGQQPCDNCSKLSVDCTFISEALPKGKTDLILNAILRMQGSLDQLDNKVSAIADKPAFTLHENDINSPSTFSSGPSWRPPFAGDSQLSCMREVENATISALHTSTTESILAWPHIDAFPSLSLQQGSSIFDLEHSRPPIASRRHSAYPYTTTSEVLKIVLQFQESVNFFYPFVAKAQLDALPTLLATGDLDDSTQSCFVLLVMALGCAAEGIKSKLASYGHSSSEQEYIQQRSALSYVYFDLALKRLHLAHLETSIQSTQCLLLAA